MITKELAAEVRAQLHLSAPECGGLCYICEYSGTAYFTSQPVSKQWGDDWDDAPYEHNAGSPYETEGVTLTKVKFSGPFSTPAQLANSNSRFSVQGINSGAIAWLIADDAVHSSIPAGVNVSRFIELVEAAGGTVYIPLSRS